MHIQRSESDLGCFTPSLSTLLTQAGSLTAWQRTSLPGLLVSGLLGSFLSVLITVVTVLSAKTSHQPQDSVSLSQFKCLFINQITYLNCRNHCVPRNSKLYLSKLVNFPASFSGSHVCSAESFALGSFLLWQMQNACWELCSSQTRFLCSFLYSLNIVPEWGILKNVFRFLFLLDL